ncbi:hypothetical protein [Bacteroides ilei]|nr:hypothetical protein [Bacteroides ilei]
MTRWKSRKAFHLQTSLSSLANCPNDSPDSSHDALMAEYGLKEEDFE